MAATVSGTDIILSDLEKMIPSDTDVDEALTAGAEIVADKTRQLAPTRTGKLKGAVGVGKGRTTKVGRTVTAGIHRRDFGPGPYYPAYVEYGHGGPRPAPPHPFLRPAYDLSKDEAWSAIKGAVIQQMEEKGL